MLVKVAEHIRVCIEQAREARERFAQVDDGLLKADFNDLEARWLRLAESYKFIEQLEVFLTDGKSFRERRALGAEIHLMAKSQGPGGKTSGALAFTRTTQTLR